MKVAILGAQNPMYFRKWMQNQLIEKGYEAEIVNMESRNFIDFSEKLIDFDAVITCGEKIPEEAVEILAKGKIKLISRWGVGTDEIDKKAAARCGIAVCNAAGSFSLCVAELALIMMLNLLREIPARDKSVRNNDWSWFFEGRISHQLEGKTVGLVGFGDIAKALARMLLGFDCEVIAYDKYWDAESALRLNVRQESPEYICSNSDIISIHLPATEETINMFNMDYFKKMKSSAFLINTARGSLIVEEDLAMALSNGVIAGAGLDVFRKEPPDPDNPLLKLDNVIVLPHSGAASWEGLEKSSAMAVANIDDFFNGRDMKTILNGVVNKF